MISYHGMALPALYTAPFFYKNAYYALVPSGLRNPLNLYVFQVRKNKKHEPEWAFLEREMRANIDKKPYNKVVGEWLVFLKDLKKYLRQVKSQELKKLIKNCGPPWYIELSSLQRDVLEDLKHDLHEDLLAGQTAHCEKALRRLGVTMKIKKKKLLKSIETCEEDPGVFIWNLFKDIYKVPPSTLLPCKDLIL